MALLLAPKVQIIHEIFEGWSDTSKESRAERHLLIGLPPLSRRARRSRACSLVLIQIQGLGLRLRSTSTVLASRFGFVLDRGSVTSVDCAISDANGSLI